MGASSAGRPGCGLLEWNRKNGWLPVGRRSERENARPYRRAGRMRLSALLRRGHPVPDVALDSFTTFGELLRHLRLRAHLTQDEFGLAVGYSRAHVARLENGQRLPDVGAVRARFAEALHLKDE